MRQGRFWGLRFSDDEIAANAVEVIYELSRTEGVIVTVFLEGKFRFDISADRLKDDAAAVILGI